MRRDDKVAIIGLGCILPGAYSFDEFSNVIYGRKRMFSEMRDERWDKKRFFSERKDDKDKSYSKIGAEVNYEKIERMMKENRIFSQIRDERWDKTTKITYLAAKQAIEGKEKYLNKSKVDFFQGIANPDERINKRFLDEKSDRHRKYETLDTIKTIKEELQIKGESGIIDAACASSIASVDISAKRLINRRCDLCLCGGSEANMDVDQFVMFSKVNALAKGKMSLPFDKRTTGFIRGEGSIIFLLKRLEDAERDGDDLFCVIEGSGAASDGNVTGIFSPSKEGQIKAYSRCYRDSGLPQHIECHATGTVKGDATEISSCDSFFNKGTTIGATKSIFGHTIGAAGSLSMLKAISIMKRHKIPGTYYLGDPLLKTDNMVINKEDKKMQTRDLKIGVSAFGFGNINYHMCLSNMKGPYKEDNSEHEKYKKRTDCKANRKISVISESKASDNGKRSIIQRHDLRIPEKSIDATDILQIRSMAGFKLILENLGLKTEDYPFKENTSIISLSEEGNIEVRKEGIQRIYSGKTALPEITEDTAAGSINNVIAGRVANYFDLRGSSFNIDSGEISLPIALQTVEDLLNEDPEQIIYLFDFLSGEGRLLSSRSYCIKTGLPIIKTLEGEMISDD